MLIERSSAGDGEVLEFVGRAIRNHEAVLEAEVISEGERLSRDRCPKKVPVLFKRMFSREDLGRVAARAT